MTSSRRKLTFLVLGVIVGVAAIVTIVLLVRRDNSSSSATTRTPLDGFGETRVSVDAPTGTLAWCMLLAETDAQHNRGLMQVTDPTLGGYDGMLFRFGDDVTDKFYMRNTPMPLSVAFVASDGHVVSTADMAPCEDRAGCPLYSAAAPYRIAIEVPQGRLGHLGIQRGAKVTDEARRC